MVMIMDIYDLTMVEDGDTELADSALPNQNAETKKSQDTPQKGKKTEKQNSSSDTSSQIKEFGQVLLDKSQHKIQLITIIGEIEGHEQLPGQKKATKYEHLLPQLAALEDDRELEGILILNNTIGGDVSCGLALAEMIASLSKPTVSLVIGDCHSIGVPLAVAADYSFIVPTGTMIIHPVRMSGMVIGAQQTYDYFELIEDRILNFISSHSDAKKERIHDMMMNTSIMTRDLGTLLVGEDAVKEGLIHKVGGIQQALEKLYEMIEQKQS